MAGNSGAIKAGRAYVEIYGDQTPLMAAMRNLPKGLMASAAGLGAAGGVIGGLIAGGITSAFSAVTDFASNLGEVGGRLVDMSDRTGIGVEALAELDHAAQMGGTSLESLEGGLRKMSVKLDEALGGSKAATKAFKSLGLSVSDLKKLSPDKQFELIADQLAKIEDPGARAAATMDIFGKSGAELLPLMKDGAEGIKKFREESARLGRLTEADAQALDQLGDTFANVSNAMNNAATTAIAAFAPSLNSVGQALIPIASWLGDIAKEIAPVLAGFGRAAADLLTVKSLLDAARGAGMGFVESFGAVGDGIASEVGGIVSDVQSMFGTLAQGFQGLFDAVAADDLSLAFEVQVATINLLWQQGLATLGIDWVEIWATIQDTFNQASGYIQTAWVDWTSSLSKFWNDLVATLADTWDYFATSLIKTFVWIEEKLGTMSKEQAKLLTSGADTTRDFLVSRRNKQNEAANASIRDDQQAQRNAIQQQRDARTADIRKNAEENSAAKQLAEARARLNAATATAAERRAMADAAKPVDPAKEMRKTATAGASAMFATSAGAISFGGAAAGMAANQGPMNKLVDSSEETAENTRLIARKIGDDSIRG